MHEIGFNHWTGIGRICTAFKNMGSKKKSVGGQAFAKACATRRSAQAEATDSTHAQPPYSMAPPSVPEAGAN